MTEDAGPGAFGCPTCWPTSAEEAAAARRALSTVADLIDESHFHVAIRSCKNCGQRFVSVFAETIDWADGDDPQYVTLLPVTEAEATGLLRLGSKLTEEALLALGRGRRSLHRDYPKGEAPYSYWATGMTIGPHD